MGQRTDRITVRNVVYHTYGELIKKDGGDPNENLDGIVREIHGYFTENNANVHPMTIREFVVELIIEIHGMDSFNVPATFEPAAVTKDVTVILNELVASGELSQNWLSE